MATVIEASKLEGGGVFLAHTVPADRVFTREDLSSAQQMFGRIAADFMRTQVLPREKEIYAKDWSLTRELLLKAGELDLLRVDIPEAYGGLGLDKVSSAYVGEQIGIMPSFAGSLGAHTAIGTLPIVYVGSADQKSRYLPRLASGEMIGAFALTEPGSGSDALAARTRATLSADGTHYILNGQKMWITNGGFADVFTIFAKVDGAQFTAFIVERDMGVVSGREEPKLGLDRSSTTALILDNVRVPVENVLGTIGEGHKVAFNILNLGRVKLGTRNIASAKQALANAARSALERRHVGRPVADCGMIRQKLAEMSVRCYVGDAMVYRALGDVDRALQAVDEADGPRVLKTIEGYAVECSVNKVWTSESLAFVVDEALQVFGGNGYSREFPAERAYRDARITRIYEGTNEINRLIIPARLLKQGAALQQDNAQAADARGDCPLAAERGLLARAKRLAIKMLTEASETYGDTLKEQQEVLGHTADVIIEVYAIESALARTEKLAAARGADAVPVAFDSARIYAADGADRITHAAKQVAMALASHGRGGSLTDVLRPIADFAGIDAIAARRRVADAVIDAGRHPF